MVVNKLLTGLIGVLITLSGCGTMHPIVPSQPLGREESTLYVTWHYDLNQLHLNDVIPDIQYYAGVGKSTVLGFGYKPLALIQHGTVVKYWKEDGDEYSYAFLHLNQFLGANTNPYIEVGGGRSYLRDSWGQSVELGLGLGNGSAGTMLSWLLDGPYGRDIRLIPFVRYVAQGRDGIFSAQYYYGLTNAHLRNLVTVLGEDTLNPPAIHAREIDSIADYRHKKRRNPYWDRGEVIARVFMTTGESFIFSVRKPYADQPGLVNPWLLFAPNPDVQIPYWDEWENTYFLELRAAAGKSTADSQTNWVVAADLDSAIAALHRGEDVQLRGLGQKRLAEVHRWQKEKKYFWNDFSLGVGTVNDDLHD